MQDRSASIGSRELRERHWQDVYGRRRLTETSWYAPHLTQSIDMIRSVAPDISSEIIDVGGGASNLVDDLLDLGFVNITVLDISDRSLQIARERTGNRTVRWLQGDVTAIQLPEGAYDVWHDRAVFHFLTDPADRRTYAELARRSIRTGGHAVMAVFAEDGPTKCSGLETARYTPEQLARELGTGFSLKNAVREQHHTPSGAVQKFVYCLFERIPGSYPSSGSRNQ